MSRLNELVPRYYANKETEKVLKKEIDADNKEIKQIMLDSNSENEVIEDYKVSCKTIVTEDFDKDLLISKLVSIWKDAGNGDVACPWIEYVPKVNDEALEDAIYNGEISPEDLKSCKVSKSQVRLTVRKVKKKED